MIGTDGNDANLNRREPEWKLAGVMLDQDPDEALQRAEQRTMDHVGRVVVVVGAHVGEPEARRHLGIELDRAHLPRAPEHVRHVQVDLRPVERAVALVDQVLDRTPVEGVLERGLGEIPLLVRSELLFRTRRELESGLHSEEVVQERCVVETAEDLVLDLLRDHEHVRIVLRDVLDAQEAVQSPARLVTVERGRLGEAHRQLAVAP